MRLRSTGLVALALLLSLAASAAWTILPTRAAGPIVSSASIATDTLILTHASVLPMTRDTVLRDRTVVISGGTIVDVYPTGARPLPPGRVRDLADAYVLPGLIDAHVHLREPPQGLVLFPANGVTTVLNLQGEPSHLSLRDSILRTGAPAPRILSSGPYLEEVAATADDARREVRRQHAAGYDIVKIHGDLDRSVFTATIDEAGAFGMPVIAHRPENLETSTVLSSDLAALAHAEELLGSSLLEEPVELSPDSVRAVARAIRESGTALITTLSFFETMGAQATDDFYELIRDPRLAYVSPDRRRAWLYDGHREYIDASELPWYEKATDVLTRIVGELHAAGGTVVAGTDTPLEFTIPGYSLHDELAILETSGLTPYEAIHSATIAPADLVGRSDLGRIGGGAAADLLIVEDDPRGSLAVLRRPVATVIRGKWYDAAFWDLELSRLSAEYARREIRRAAEARVVDEIAATVADEGLAAGVDLIARLNDDPALPDVAEADVNALGYRLLGADDVDAAIAVFRLNVELHPESANVYDSLGEAYLAAGRLAAAERSYRRALELDPTMGSSRSGLERIEERRTAPD